MSTETSDLINRLAAAAGDVRALLTEVHQANKDLKASMREYRELIRTGVEEAFAAKVAEQLDEIGEQTRKAMDDSVAKVGAEFDKLAKLYLEGPTPGELSLAELAARKTARMGIPRCPHCGMDANGYSTVDGSDSNPGPGDYSMCWGCGQLSLWTATHTLRRATADELARFLAVPTNRVAHNELNASVRLRKAGSKQVRT